MDRRLNWSNFRQRVNDHRRKSRNRHYRRNEGGNGFRRNRSKSRRASFGRSGERAERNVRLRHRFRNEHVYGLHDTGAYRAYLMNEAPYKVHERRNRTVDDQRRFARGKIYRPALRTSGKRFVHSGLARRDPRL